MVEVPQKQFDLAGPTQWLKGEQKRLSEPDNHAPAPGTKRHYITPGHAAQLTEGFLSLVSNEAFQWFASGMPQKYELERHRYIELVDNLPHLGYCSFASIQLRKPDGSKYFVRLHFANFNAKIDTTPGARFFDSQSKNRGAMFFGVAFCPDGNTDRSVMLDRSVHHSGISFITTDPTQALDYAVFLRTGVKSEEWRKMAAKKTADGKRAA
jgi:hypothetical protein